MVVVIDIDCKKDIDIQKFEKEVINSIAEILKKNRDLRGYKLISSSHPSTTIQFGRL